MPREVRNGSVDSIADLMPSPVYGRSRDKNEREIIQALQKVGWLVAKHDLYDLDICCPRCKTILAIEVKMPQSTRAQGATGRSAGRLTPKQKELLESGWPLQVVSSVTEAVTLATQHQCSPVGTP